MDSSDYRCDVRLIQIWSERRDIGISDAETLASYARGRRPAESLMFRCARRQVRPFEAELQHHIALGIGLGGKVGIGLLRLLGAQVRGLLVLDDNGAGLARLCRDGGEKNSDRQKRDAGHAGRGRLRDKEN